MSFRALFEHVDACEECNRVELDLCAVGRKLRDATFEQTAEAIAPIPVVREDPLS